MASIVDLLPCSYLPVVADHILAVGWLEKSIAFPIGPTSSDVYSRLKEFAADPWQPFVAGGCHECEVCQFEGEANGFANLYIPYQGKIYVCPALITHYINSHRYQPPTIFCEAVLSCPPMRSMKYKRLLIECHGNVLWQYSKE